MYLCLCFHDISDYETDVKLALPHGFEGCRGSHLCPEQMQVEVALHPQVTGILCETVSKQKHKKSLVNGVRHNDLHSKQRVTSDIVQDLR